MTLPSRYSNFMIDDQLYAEPSLRLLGYHPMK
jgi:hypothetical protein